MSDYAARAVASLEADFPAWQVWVVHRAYGSPVYCARRWDETGEVLNAASADELRRSLEAEAGRR